MKQSKKNYLSPEVKIVDLKHQRPLLAGSQLQSFRNGGKIDDWSDWDDEEEQGE